jgi:hypothetical protein
MTFLCQVPVSSQPPSLETGPVFSSLRLLLTSSDDGTPFPTLLGRVFCFGTGPWEVVVDDLTAAFACDVVVALLLLFGSSLV